MSSTQIYRYCAAPWYRIVMRQSAKHKQNSSPFDTLCLKKINDLVFELNEFKQRNRETKILKTAKMSRVSNLKICFNIEITDKQSNFICVCLDVF
jgi:hypothetical protein